MWSINDNLRLLKAVDFVVNVDVVVVDVLNVVVVALIVFNGHIVCSRR